MNPPSRSSDAKPFLFLALALAVPVGAGVYSLMLTKAPTTVSNNGFNVLKVDQSKEQPYVPTVSYSSPNDTSPMPLVGRLRVSPTMRPDTNAAQANGAGAYGATRPAEGPMTPQRIKEQQFLGRYGNDLARYEGKLNRITMRYYRQDPVVREVDRAFGSMPRYMAVKQRYGQNHDPFEFVRDSVALPEVRAEIRKRMADPRVWRASLGMVFDAMRDPPPAPIYNAAKDFVTKDGQVSDYMNGFTNDVFANMPTNQNVLPPNADMGVLWKLVNDIKPDAAAMSSATAVTQQPRH